MVNFFDEFTVDRATAVDKTVRVTVNMNGCGYPLDSFELPTADYAMALARDIEAGAVTVIPVFGNRFFFFRDNEGDND